MGGPNHGTRAPSGRARAAVTMAVRPLRHHCIGGDAEMQHAAGQRAGFVNLDGVPEAPEVIRGGEAAGARADDEHTFTRRGGRRGQRPALAQGEVTQKAFDGVDADGAVELLAITGGFARMVTDTAVDGGQRILGDELLPRRAIASRLSEGEPRLDVLAGGAGGVARRQMVDVDRALQAYRAAPAFAGQIDDGRDISVAHLPASSVRGKNSR